MKRLPLVRVLCAVVAGLLGTIAFPPYGWWPLAFVSVAGLSILTRGQRVRTGALLGFGYAAGLFLPMLHFTSIYVGAAPWLILTFSQTWYVTALGAVLPLVQRCRFPAVLTAGAWVAEEALRSRAPFGGFPWGRWGFSQATSPLRWFAALGGVPLVTFVVALIGALLAGAITGPGLIKRPMRLATALVLVLLGGALAWPLKPPAAPRTVTIAAIQGDVPDRGLEFNARRRQVLDNHVTQTLLLAAQVAAGKVAKPQLVLWPENASDIDPTDNADAAVQIQRAADAVGVPILVGAVLDGPGPDHISNAGLVWFPSSAPKPGPGQVYVKRHPVPFAEYIPLRSIARLISSDVDLVPRDMVSGTGNGLITDTPFPIGDVICFEVAYDSLVRSSVKAGAQMLVIQTNNATFGHTGETYQQLAMSKLRAVETGRTVVQVATSGKSAIIAPDGHVEAESGALFTPAILVRTVPLSTATTLDTRIGAQLEWVLVALGLLGIGAGARLERKERKGRAQPTARTKERELTETRTV
ncbi:MAG: Apolipoprotein N-acyltransferase [Frankiales bacterium]|nr:Apolipoprotein N-acyltransferase [Frankiales bacterium]